MSGKSARTERPRYLCEWRDLHFLVRFVRKVCCFPPAPGRLYAFVNIDILRTDAPGLCDVKSAAERLFILPIYGFLNGCLGQITLHKNSTWPQDQPGRDKVCIDLRSPDSLFPGRRFVLDQAPLDIPQFVQNYRSTSSAPRYQWDFRLADQIWGDRVRRLTNFVRDAQWESREPSNPRTHSNWETLALNTFNEVHDQWPSFKGFMVVGNPTHQVRHFKVQRSLYFLTGMGYLLLSYLPQQAIDGLTGKRILSPTQRTGRLCRRSPESLADEALSAFLNTTAPPDVIAANPDNESAVAFYCNCAIAEAYIRVSAALIGKAWCWIYRALKIVCSGVTKEQRAWLRMFMRKARLCVKDIRKSHELLAENRWDADGSLRGEWFRRVIVQDLVVRAGERGLGQRARGIFEEAMEVDAKEWVERFVSET